MGVGVGVDGSRESERDGRESREKEGVRSQSKGGRSGGSEVVIKRRKGGAREEPIKVERVEGARGCRSR